MKDTQRLAQRTAIVTGASRGLGLHIARAYTAAGASVTITGRDQATIDTAARSMREDGAQVHAIRADVAVAEECERVVAETEERFGPLTILVNNAGIYGPMGPIETVDFDQWRATIEINLYGPVLMTRAAVPGMRERGYGKIVNLSGGGATGPLPMISAYAASKVAVVRLTETFAHELSEARIDVNAIAPGALNTRMLQEVLAAGPEAVGEDFYAKARLQEGSGGADPAAGARLAVFLGSGDSDGISGRLLSALWDEWEYLPTIRKRIMAGDVYTLRRIVPEDRGR